jgi:hypothetical protein
MRVIVCGGRDFRNEAFIYRELDSLHVLRPITDLMHGGASGVDTIAGEWARTKPEIQRFVCHADWKAHGRAAGPMRNLRMLEWKPDLVVAFPGGLGTNNMVNQALVAGVPVMRIR